MTHQDTNLLQHSDECEDEVFIDDGWILVEPGSPEGILHENEVLQQDCVPMGSSMLVPIDRIAQPTHGIIFAAGPQGNQMCEIIRQEPARRSIAQFSVADCGTFRLTGDHELKIRRGGVWSVVQAREVQVGDFVTTPEGEKEVVHRGEPKSSSSPAVLIGIRNPFQGWPFWGKTPEMNCPMSPVAQCAPLLPPPSWEQPLPLLLRQR